MQQQIQLHLIQRRGVAVDGGVGQLVLARRHVVVRLVRILGAGQLLLDVLLLLDVDGVVGSGSGRAGDIASETRAAAGGGITHMAAQPDCGPVDSTAVVRLIRERLECCASLAAAAAIWLALSGRCGAAWSAAQAPAQSVCLLAAGLSLVVAALYVWL